MSLRWLRPVKILRVNLKQMRLMSTDTDEKNPWSSTSSSSSGSGSSSSDDEAVTSKPKEKGVADDINPNRDVPGLSSKVLTIPEHGLGPGISKTGTYKNPEYYSYHSMSFYEAEIELMCYRLPQPSAFDPLIFTNFYRSVGKAVNTSFTKNIAISDTLSDYIGGK